MLTDILEGVDVDETVLESVDVPWIVSAFPYSSIAYAVFCLFWIGGSVTSESSTTGSTSTSDLLGSSIISVCYFY